MSDDVIGSIIIAIMFLGFFGGEPVLVLIAAWLKKRTEFKAREQKHRHKLELARELGGAVQLLSTDKALEDDFMTRLEEAHVAQKTTGSRRHVESDEDEVEATQSKSGQAR